MGRKTTERTCYYRSAGHPSAPTGCTLGSVSTTWSCLLLSLHNSDQHSELRWESRPWSLLVPSYFLIPSVPQLILRNWIQAHVSFRYPSHPTAEQTDQRQLKLLSPVPFKNQSPPPPPWQVATQAHIEISGIIMILLLNRALCFWMAREASG